MDGRTTEQNSKFSEEPWRERDKLPNARVSHTLLLSLAVLVSSLALFLSSNEQISFFSILVLAAFGVHGMRRIGATALLLGSAAIVSLFIGHLGGAAAFLALVIGTGALAFLLTTTARPYAVAIPLAVGVGVYFLTQDPLQMLLALSFLPSGVLLAVATLTHQRRTSAICFSIGGLLLSLGGILALLLYRACGSLELSTVTAFMERLLADLTETVLHIRDEFLVYMEEALIAEGSTEAEITRSLEMLRETMSDGLLTEAIAVLYSILPAIAVVLCATVSFGAQLLLSHYYFYLGWRDVLTRDSTVFLMSVPAAVVYLISFVCTAFLGVSSVLGAAMQNLCLMLLPGLCVVGWGAVLGMLRKSSGGTRVFLILVAVGGVCCAGFSVFYFLALWGAYTCVLAAIGRRLVERAQETSDGRFSDAAFRPYDDYGEDGEGTDGDSDGDSDKDPDAENGFPWGVEEIYDPNSDGEEERSENGDGEDGGEDRDGR